MLVQDPADAHAPANNSVHQKERVLDDHQLPCTWQLAPPAALRIVFELKRVAANVRDHPVSGSLAVLGVESLKRPSRSHPARGDHYKPLACRHAETAARRPRQKPRRWFSNPRSRPI